MSSMAVPPAHPPPAPPGAAPWPARSPGHAPPPPPLTRPPRPTSHSRRAASRPAAGCFARRASAPGIPRAGPCRPAAAGGRLLRAHENDPIVVSTAPAQGASPPCSGARHTPPLLHPHSPHADGPPRPPGPLSGLRGGSTGGPARPPPHPPPPRPPGTLAPRLHHLDDGSSASEGGGGFHQSGGIFSAWRLSTRTSFPITQPACSSAGAAPRAPVAPRGARDPRALGRLPPGGCP